MRSSAIALLLCLTAPAATASPVVALPVDEAMAQCLSMGPDPAEKIIAGCTSAIQSYRERDDVLTVMYLHRGDSWFNLGELGRAIGDYEQASRLAPEYRAIANFRLGQAEAAAGDYPRSAEYYGEAVRLEPHGWEAHFYRGRANAMSGDQMRARADYDEALRMSPDAYSTVLEHRAVVSFLLGDFQAAWNDFDSKFRMTPTSTFALYGRGMAALRLGRESEGRADIAVAVATNSNVARSFASRVAAPSAGAAIPPPMFREHLAIAPPSGMIANQGSRGEDWWTEWFAPGQTSATARLLVRVNTLSGEAGPDAPMRTMGGLSFCLGACSDRPMGAIDRTPFPGRPPARVRIDTPVTIVRHEATTEFALVVSGDRDLHSVIVTIRGDISTAEIMFAENVLQSAVWCPANSRKRQCIERAEADMPPVLPALGAEP